MSPRVNRLILTAALCYGANATVWYITYRRYVYDRTRDPQQPSFDAPHPLWDPSQFAFWIDDDV